MEEFLAADSESAREALVLEQLLRVQTELGGALEPTAVREPTSEMAYRNDLLRSLKSPPPSRISSYVTRAFVSSLFFS